MLGISGENSSSSLGGVLSVISEYFESFQTGGIEYYSRMVERVLKGSGGRHLNLVRALDQGASTSKAESVGVSVYMILKSAN